MRHGRAAHRRARGEARRMSNTIGPIKLFLVRTAAAACLTLLVSAEAAAQQPLASPPSTPRFISRSDVQLVAAALAHDDQRFTWDTHLIADFDLVDYMHGRITCSRIIRRCSARSSGRSIRIKAPTRWSCRRRPVTRRWNWRVCSTTSRGILAIDRNASRST